MVEHWLAAWRTSSNCDSLPITAESVNLLMHLKNGIDAIVEMENKSSEAEDLWINDVL